MSLFPILADANPPSSLTGLDVSLAAGQMTALDGADSFTMTASTLTANAVSASWADIVDAVVNPPADQDLQSVLNAGSSASTADGGVASISLADGTDTSSMSASQIDLVADAGSSAMSAVIVSLTAGDLTSSLGSAGVNCADATGATLTSELSASSLSMVSGTDTTSLSVGSLSMVDAAASTTLTDGSLVLMDIPNTSIATLTYDSVAVGKDSDYVEMTKDNLVLANATVSMTLTPESIAMGDATYNSSITTPTSAVQKLVVASSKQIELDAEQNVVLSAGDDSVSFLRNALLTTEAGGSTNQYLSMLINGVVYRISLLAQPTYPLRTITTISIGGGQNIFVQEPYYQWDYYTISYTITGWTGSADSSFFEILSYPTNAFQPDVSYSVKKVFINGNGSVSFSVQNLTPDRYNAVQFFQTSANAFNVTSFIINGTQQIAAPNPVPLVCPP
jgi:hypothetical protein